MKKAKKNKGYILIYSMIAMMLTCALVLSTVSIVLYYGNNVGRAVGGNGALYAAESGTAALENYLNAYYIDKGNLKTRASDLWITVDDIVGEISPVVDDNNPDGKALLALQGYMNYNYVIAAGRKTKSLNADTVLSGAYKVYIADSMRNDIRTKGEITMLSVGEYVFNGKTYYKFITVTAVIEPVFISGMITGLELRTVDYSESLKGGTDLWGNIKW